MSTKDKPTHQSNTPLQCMGSETLDFYWAIYLWEQIRLTALRYTIISTKRPPDSTL